MTAERFVYIFYGFCLFIAAAYVALSIAAPELAACVFRGVGCG